MEALIRKLNCITDAWKDQFDFSHSKNKDRDPYLQTPPDLPLVWKVEDGILFLDDVWITPIKYIKQENLAEAPQWVNPLAMEIDLTDGSLNVIITKWGDQFSISGVERVIV